MRTCSSGCFSIISVLEPVVSVQGHSSQLLSARTPRRAMDTSDKRKKKQTSTPTDSDCTIAKAEETLLEDLQKIVLSFLLALPNPSRTAAISLKLPFESLLIHTSSSLSLAIAISFLNI